MALRTFILALAAATAVAATDDAMTSDMGMDDAAMSSTSMMPAAMTTTTPIMDYSVTTKMAETSSESTSMPVMPTNTTTVMMGMSKSVHTTAPMDDMGMGGMPMGTGGIMNTTGVPKMPVSAGTSVNGVSVGLVVLLLSLGVAAQL